MADSLLQGMYYASTIDKSCILNIIDGPDGPDGPDGQ